MSSQDAPRITNTIDYMTRAWQSEGLRWTDLIWTPLFALWLCMGSRSESSKWSTAQVGMSLAISFFMVVTIVLCAKMEKKAISWRVIILFAAALDIIFQGVRFFQQLA